jgi:hypothetical protein
MLLWFSENVKITIGLGSFLQWRCCLVIVTQVLASRAYLFSYVVT